MDSVTVPFLSFFSLGEESAQLPSRVMRLDIGNLHMDSACHIRPVFCKHATTRQTQLEPCTAPTPSAVPALALGLVLGIDCPILYLNW